MSFSFGFSIGADELDDELDIPTDSLRQLDIKGEHEHPEASSSTVPYAEVPLSELLGTLPPLLSYTPVVVPLSSSKGRTATLLRRDLFDARFQILNQDEDVDPDAPEESVDKEGTGTGKGKGKGKEVFVDEQSDLVKGVYEGGLKTWECSLDLVDCLDQRGFTLDAVDNTSFVRGTSVLEVGCGTAIPTCAVFARLLNEIARDPTPEDAPKPKKTRIHVQDYNKQVLQLITFPNLLLTYAQHFLLPAAAAATESKAPDADEEPTEPATDDSSTRPGELEVSPEFLDSFESFLARENIDLRFFEGDWAGMDKAIRAGGDDDELYDLVLTSETVYSVPSLGPLIDLLEAATTRADFSGGAGGGGTGSSCLVACKRIYFGVGGGELEFRRRVEERGAQVESVWGEGEGKGKNSGVGRTVLSVRWSKRSKKEVL
ncbi:hypothetical protein BMF94_2569 [Rhodotorula taiwanensis]|uniref:protein-histidine N-methyltransferase n=1 Tax=Rhodotorula taiwanensis TaxID=741276 RepID=A0A2S5BC72_9BASI|nr:hypothetical protein BMF94_2569 [Rhodotorula taiwanensis]